MTSRSTSKSKKRSSLSIAGLFDSIADNYDRFNHLSSLNIDRLWRRKALRQLVIHGDNVTALDVACGTADLSIELVRQGVGHVVGVDISEGMLRNGRDKVVKADLEERINLEIADCARLPYADETFDIVTAAFGVRNFEKRKESLKEMCRVMKRGGQLMILEFSKPSYFPVKQLYNFYFKRIMP
ncbi:MAG TPA: bifunctional demethylmenaquinone methyltransferase/2-methoxy-6-polyprenyl-1,4-benzoquinol methylase, partial [Bacteroidales bacterium]|nr:bifunctional demethylmenaquinone methyltransferase/2-methoxy-6-polyprenyl-1,4-benzoquinol methylase [Bacteroidales bacterium]